MICQPPRLIAVDLDGTSVRYEPRFEIDPVFLDAVRPWLRAGGEWVMNSDRGLGHMLEIADYLEPADRPRALLSRQKDIYFREPKGYVSHHDWNQRTNERFRRLFAALRPAFAEWVARLETEFEILDRYVEEQAFAFMTTREATPALRRRLTEFVAPWPETRVSGNDQWSFLIHESFSKGRVLQEAARRLEIEPGAIIAVGDGENDLSMLDGTVTGRVGCPANAVAEVKRAVDAAGGLIAQGLEAAGTVEVVRHYLGAAGAGA